MSDNPDITPEQAETMRRQKALLGDKAWRVMVKNVKRAQAGGQRGIVVWTLGRDPTFYGEARVASLPWPEAFMREQTLGFVRLYDPSQHFIFVTILPDAILLGIYTFEGQPAQFNLPETPLTA